MIWHIKLFDESGYEVGNIERNFPFLPQEFLTIEYPEDVFYKLTCPPTLDIVSGDCYLTARRILEL